jgi:glycosyltransferase involved in cell wall biosynthesis
MQTLKVDYILGRRTDEMTGMRRYAREIIERGGSEVDSRFIDHDIDMRIPDLQRIPGLFFYPFIVAREKREGSIKHLCSHIQAHLLNYMRLRPSVVTCYDIYPFLQERYPFVDKSMVKLGIRGMLKADRIIAISRFSREEITRTLDYPRERVRVIYLGVDQESYRPLPRNTSVAEKYGVPADRRIVLYVGSEQPRKNLTVLMQAFAAVRKEVKDAILLKVGRPQWKGAREGLRARIEHLGLDDDVLFIDYIDEIDLPALYNLADVFAFPSRYEGFGLPPLEAMACGCPVVASGTSSLPEVIGEAGITVNPDDAEGLADAICRVLDDGRLRSSMIAAGLEQAKRFSWEATSRETIAVYRELLEE